MGLLIKNGTVVTADSHSRADIWCDDETITTIGRHLDAPANARVIDAKDKYVFPGFVDPHTHIHLPFMGTFAKDDYESATVAALCGGTTTVFDFVVPYAGDSFVQALEQWQDRAAGNACADYGLHFSVTRWDDEAAAAMAEIVRRGVTSWKVFLAYKGALSIDDEALFEVLTLARRLGVLTMAHTENAELVARLQNALLAAGKTGPEWHEPSRPVALEAEGANRFATFVEVTGATGYVVHVSCKAALDHLVAARRRGVNVTIETVAPYLFLDRSYAERKNFEGAKYVMSPPLRHQHNQTELWKALADGRIQTVGTDHAPFDSAQKRLGEGDFTKIPNGIASIEDRVRLLYTRGVHEGRLDLQQFVAVASTNAARVLGIFPHKGTIAVGADADLVVYDPRIEETISAQTHHINMDYSAFEGMKVQGRCAAVTVRGKVQVHDGQFVGDKGWGRFLARDPMPPDTRSAPIG